MSGVFGPGKGECDADLGFRMILPISLTDDKAGDLWKDGDRDPIPILETRMSHVGTDLAKPDHLVRRPRTCFFSSGRPAQIVEAVYQSVVFYPGDTGVSQARR